MFSVLVIRLRSLRLLRVSGIVMRLRFFFSSRRRHTRFDCDWSQTCALPISRPAMRLAELVDAGARRVSVGGSLTWAAVKAFADAAIAILDDGDFSPLDADLPLGDWFSR